MPGPLRLVFARLVCIIHCDTEMPDLFVVVVGAIAMRLSVRGMVLSHIVLLFEVRWMM